MKKKSTRTKTQKVPQISSLTSYEEQELINRGFSPDSARNVQKMRINSREKGVDKLTKLRRIEMEKERY
jgi:hypothetical protein